MPFFLARYWDSLESAEYLESPTLVPERKDLDSVHFEWLRELQFSTEHECQSILYAKSLLSSEEERVVPNTAKFVDTVPQRIAVGVKCSSLNGEIPPPKPQRRIARLKNSRNETIATQTVPTYSTLDLIEACKFGDNTKSASSFFINHDKSKTHSSRPTECFQNWTPPGYRPTHRESSTQLSAASSCSSNINQSAKPQPPKYEQLRIRVGGDGEAKVVVSKRSAALRHTIAVNQEDLERARASTRQALSTSLVGPSSPKSMNSDSTLSVDSGQCSGDVALTSQHSFSSSREEKEEAPPTSGGQATSEMTSSIYQAYSERCLPGYARVASTMDHVLRTSSAIYSLLSSSSSEWEEPGRMRDLHAKAAVFIQILEASPCSHHLPKYDINVVKMQIHDMQRSANSDVTSNDVAPPTNNYFMIVVRKMVEQVLQMFARIICKYLTECGNRDRLVIIALEHLIHIALFGDELSLEIIQCGGLSCVLRLVRHSSTPTDTARLLLRTLAVLCGVAKGCLSLLALGGLDVVLSLLSSSSISCSIEAAGVLTQLTNPQHSFVKLERLENILSRLLALIDECTSGESLLLVSAALSNVSLQDANAIDILYRQNAITRLIQAYNRQDCSTIFVQEQLVTIMSRLAARRYEEALVAQGAIPMLLEMLTVTDNIHSDYCRRIRYKAAVCVGTLAATGVGLKALYTNQGYAILCHVLEMENSSANPLNMICTNIRNKLESKYQIESAV